MSAKIASKIRKSCRSKTLAHALALIGLGGTGKTQLVLHYIEQHRERYDTITWLDVRDELTTMSNFKRCCGALSIACTERLTEGLLHDAPAVQKLLAWLAARGKEQKWLVVRENADGFDERSELTHIISGNAFAGSVIIASQDGKATKLIPRAKCTNIDKMEIDQCKALLAQSMDIDLSQASLGLTSCLEKLANQLDGLALALDLASARIRDDIDSRYVQDIADTEAPVITAIEQYLVDLDEHAKSVLSDSELSAIEKTVCSVWETIFKSLERSEQRDAEAGVSAMQLLKLAVVLGPAIVHQEVFRAASQSLAEVCTGFIVDVPEWLKSLLQVSKAGVWDSFAYRKSVARLKRFNLIRPASQNIFGQHVSIFDNHPESVSWSGFTIHSLVRWCTGVQTPQADFEICRVALVCACCHTWNDCDDGIDFRPALFEYIRHRGKCNVIAFTEDGFADSCSIIGTNLARVRGYEFAGCFLESARDLKAELFGETALETREVEVELGRFYRMRSLSYGNLMDGNVDAEKAKRVLKRILEHPEGKIIIAAASWDATVMGLQLSEWSSQVAKEERQYLSGKGEPTRRSETWRRYFGELAAAISDQLEALQLGEHCLGQHHHVVSKLRSNLAKMYGHSGSFDLAKKHLEDLLAHDEQSLDKFNGRTMRNTERLATYQFRLRNFDAATKTMRELCSNSGTALGPDDPRTRVRERRLERLNNLISAAVSATTKEKAKLEQEFLTLEWYE